MTDYALSAEFATGLLELCLKEARRIRGTTMSAPDAYTGLDASKPIDIFTRDNVNGAPIRLKPGWYGNAGGIGGYQVTSPRYFAESITFVPWNNISTTHV